MKCVEIDLLCVVCWAQVVFIGILSCGKDFTFRYVSGPRKANPRAHGLSAGCFETLLWPTQFSLTLSTLWTSERLYDWLIERQQPREILYHGPGLYFPFLLKFLLTHSPRALSQAWSPLGPLDLIRAICVQCSGPISWKGSKDSRQMMLFWRYWGPFSLQNQLPLQCHSHPGHGDTLELHNYKCTPWA